MESQCGYGLAFSTVANGRPRFELGVLWAAPPLSVELNGVEAAPHREHIACAIGVAPLRKCPARTGAERMRIREHRSVLKNKLNCRVC